MASRTVATAEDLFRLASEGKRYELVYGELVEMSPTGVEHGSTERRFGRIIGDFGDDHDLGETLVGEVLFCLDRARRLFRAADVAFIAKGRLPVGQLPRGAFDGAPDLVVEIISPGDSAEAIHEKLREWLAYGARIVLQAYPGTRTIEVVRPEGLLILSADDELTLDPVLPGFRCQVSRFFPAGG
jgi:Uma2 family endonuclease